jgi:hypothetical protein
MEVLPKAKTMAVQIAWRSRSGTSHFAHRVRIALGRFIATETNCVGVVATNLVIECFQLVVVAVGTSGL